MKIIPNFSKFALNGNKVVTVSTGKEKACKTGTDKYQLHDDDGKSHALTVDQIKSLLKPEKAEAKPKATAKKAQVTDEAKTPSKKEQILELYKQGKTPAEIEEATGIKANTVFVAIKIHRIMSLHEKGKTPEEISEKTGYKVDSVIWQIAKSGR